MNERPPPSDVTAEMGVIAAILTDPYQIAQVGYLTPDFFTHPLYRLAWRAIEDLTHDGAPIEQLAVEDRMDMLDHPLMADQGHLLTQASLAVEGFTSARTYAKQVLECAQLRQMIREAQRIVQDGYTRALSARDLGESVLSRFTRILSVSPDQQTGRASYPEVLDHMATSTMDRMDNPDLAIRTGYPAIDKINGGFEPGELILIAGRPGSGKSALGLSMARRMAGYFHKTHAGCVDVVTLEMSPVAQARRLIAWRSGLDSRQIRQGFRVGNDIDQDAFDRFLATLEKDKADVGEALAFHQHAMTSEQLMVTARQSQAQHGMRVLIIDQLDLMADTNKDETARIGQISLNLKRLAMALKIVIICLVQLNRNTESRNGGEKRPQLADLRQSGRLEMDADIVYGVYRPEYYFPRNDDDPPAYEFWAELIPLKYRDGQSGRAIPLRFVKNAGSYDDWADDFYPTKDMIALVAKKEGRK